MLQNDTLAAEVVGPLHRQAIEGPLADGARIDQTGKRSSHLKQRDVLHHAVVGPGREVRRRRQQVGRPRDMLENLRRVLGGKHRMRTVAGPEADDDSDARGNRVVVPEESVVAPGAAFVARIAEDQIARRGQVQRIAAGSIGAHEHVGGVQARERQRTDAGVPHQVVVGQLRHDGMLCGRRRVTRRRQPAVGEHQRRAVVGQRRAQWALRHQFGQGGVVRAAAQRRHDLRERRRAPDECVEDDRVEHPQDDDGAEQICRQPAPAVPVRGVRWRSSPMHRWIPWCRCIRLEQTVPNSQHDLRPAALRPAKIMTHFGARNGPRPGGHAWRNAAATRTRPHATARCHRRSLAQDFPDGASPRRRQRIALSGEPRARPGQRRLGTAAALQDRRAADRQCRFARLARRQHDDRSAHAGQQPDRRRLSAAAAGAASALRRRCGMLHGGGANGIRRLHLVSAQCLR